MTRQEHMDWCKKRALEYLDKGDVANAVASMLSDLSKHPETTIPPELSMIGMLSVMSNDRDGARRFIVGFN